jgi:phosphatidylglycerophosphatase A
MINVQIARMIATFFYCGKFPVAPGTLATAAGLALAWFLRWNFWAYLLVMAAVIVLGFVASGVAEKSYGRNKWLHFPDLANRKFACLPRER